MKTDRFNRLLLVTASLAALISRADAQTVVTQAEPDDTLATANTTGITAGFTGVLRATGNNGDGDFGTVDGNEDVDFYKITVAANQVINMELQNAGNNGDFDSAIGIFDSDGNFLAGNDDIVGGTFRGSRLSYTATTAGDYYICVSNWITGGAVDRDNFPTDPTTAGTMIGQSGGTTGPYALFVAIDSTLPVVGFDGAAGGNPQPFVAYLKTPGTNQYSGPLQITNAGGGPLTITAATITGSGAAKFGVTGLSLPATIPAGGSVNLTVTFDSGGSNTLAEAALDLTSNDPFDLSFPLRARGGLLAGGGFWDVVQRKAGVTVGDWFTAGQVIDGTIESTPTTANPLVINYSGDATVGFFPNNSPFPSPGENFVTVANATIRVTQAGDYTFRGFSDDGQRLFVDDVLIDIEHTDYNTPHFYTVNLTAGSHTVSFQQYEGGGGDNMEISVAQELGAFTTSEETTWELVEGYSDDTDGDGLPDAYEQSFFPADPAYLTRLGPSPADFDTDGVSDVTERTNSTNPTLADTDGDGLSDKVETDTGVWVGATDTGTDPLLADTDGDYARDGVETNTGVYVSAANTGTNPFVADTDLDGFEDGLEAPYGASPIAAGSVPLAAGQSLLLAWWPFNDNATPGVAKDSIAGITGTNTGTYTGDTEGRTGAAGDRAMFFDTSAGPSQRINVENGKFMNMATRGDAITISYWQKINEVRNSSAFWAVSPSSAGTTRGIQVHSPWSDSNIYFDNSGCCDANLTRISTPMPGEANVFEWVHFAFVKTADRKEIWVNGQLALSGTGNPLPTDITNLFIGAGIADYTNGYLDDFAVFAGGLSEAQIGQLAAGTSPPAIISTPPPASFEITSVVTKADGSIDITFTSAAGTIYAVQTSTDLTAWSNVGANITGAAGTTTTTVPGPLAPGRRFLKVVTVPPAP